MSGGSCLWQWEVRQEEVEAEVQDDHRSIRTQGKPWLHVTLFQKESSLLWLAYELFTDCGIVLWGLFWFLSG